MKLSIPVISEVKIRRFRNEHIEGGLLLSRAAGWPYGREDWEFCTRTGDGFAVLHRSRVVGTGFYWRQGRNVTMLGVMLVARDMQRKGIGRLIIDELVADRTSDALMLNATKEGMGLFEAAGFVPVCTVAHHAGVPVPERLFKSPWVRNGEPSRLGEVLALDKMATGKDRSRIFRDLERCATRLDLIRNDQVYGFAYRRSFAGGYAIGPVVAKTKDEAVELLSHWFQTTNAPLHIDVPDRLISFGTWLEENGLARVGEALLMARGSLSKVRNDFVPYALVSQAIG